MVGGRRRGWGLTHLLILSILLLPSVINGQEESDNEQEVTTTVPTVPAAEGPSETEEPPTTTTEGPVTEEPVVTTTEETVLTTTEEEPVVTMTTEEPVVATSEEPLVTTTEEPGVTMATLAHVLTTTEVPVVVHHTTTRPTTKPKPKPKHTTTTTTEAPSTPPDEETIIQVLGKKVKEMHLDYFTDDVLLLQQVDAVNDVTKYKSLLPPQEGKGDVVFTRQANDKGKDVVILSKEEDKVKLRSGEEKQTWVVLKKHPKATPAVYFVNYAYLRCAKFAYRVSSKPSDTSSQDNLIFDNGYSMTVEWDVWEDRSEKRPLIWTNCDSTIFISCGFNESAFTDYSIYPKDKLFISPPKKSRKGKLSIPPPPPPKKNKTIGDETEFQYPIPDFFDDLQIDLAHGRSMNPFNHLSKITGGVSGASGTVVKNVTGGASQIVYNLVGNRTDFLSERLRVAADAVKDAADVVDITLRAAHNAIANVESKGIIAGLALTIKGALSGTSMSVAVVACGSTGILLASMQHCKGKSKMLIDKNAKVEYEIGPGVQGRYFPRGTFVRPMPPIFTPSPPRINSGAFNPDNTKIASAAGLMVPLGDFKPYIVQFSDPKSVGTRLPKDFPTTGIYMAENGKDSAHGVFVPVTEGTGILIPDGMGYPCRVQVRQPAILGRGYCIPSFPGLPDTYVMDSGLTSPLRSLNPLVPVSVIVSPEPPNLSNEAVRMGQLYMNKMPPIFITDGLRASRVSFVDDKKIITPRPTGYLIPQINGLPDIFIPDDVNFATRFKVPIGGIMVPEQQGHSAIPITSGILGFPRHNGDYPKFITDASGGYAIFQDVTGAISVSGAVAPFDPKRTNIFYLATGSPFPAAKGTRVRGVLYPLKPNRLPIQGELIVSKSDSPYYFVPHGIGTNGDFFPADRSPTIPGTWVPGLTGPSDELIPLNEPDEGFPPQLGAFVDPVNPTAAIPVNLGSPQSPGGPNTLLNFQRRPSPSPVEPFPGTDATFTSDIGPSIRCILLAVKPPPGAPLSCVPSPPESYPPGGGMVRGNMATPGGGPPQHGKLLSPQALGGPAVFVLDPPNTVPARYVIDGMETVQIPGLLYTGASGSTTLKFEPDAIGQIPGAQTHGTVAKLAHNTQPMKGLMGPGPRPPQVLTEFILDPDGASLATFTFDLDRSVVIGGLFVPIPGMGEGSGTLKPLGQYVSAASSVVSIIHGKLSVMGSPRAVEGVLAPPHVPGQPLPFNADPKGGVKAGFVPDANPTVPVPMIYVAPANEEDETKLIPIDSSRLPEPPVMGSLVIDGKRESEHGALTVGTSTLIFTADIEVSVTCNFVPDQDTQVTVVGEYVAADGKGLGKFTARTIDDFGNLIPLQQLSPGTIMCKEGNIKVHGVLQPPATRSDTAEFMEDPQGTAPAIGYLDSIPGKAFPGLWKQPNIFMPLDRAAFPEGNSHGHLQPSQVGQPVQTVIFHNGGPTEDIDFTPDPVGTKKASFKPDGDGPAIDGLYSNGDPTQFKPLTMRQLPKGQIIHGQIIEENSAGQPGVLDTKSVSDDAAPFYPDPPGSSVVGFTKIGEAEESFKVVYMPPPTAGATAQMRVIEQKVTEPIHGKVLETNFFGEQKLVTGVLQPAKKPQEPSVFEIDKTATFIPDSNPSAPIVGAIYQPDGAKEPSFIPDKSFEISDFISGAIDVPGLPRKHGGLQAPQGGMSPFGSDPPNVIPGKLVQDTKAIFGYFMNSTSTFRAYDKSQMFSSGPATFESIDFKAAGAAGSSIFGSMDFGGGFGGITEEVKDPKIKSGSALCKGDVNSECIFKILKSGSVTGMLSLFSADSMIPVAVDQDKWNIEPIDPADVSKLAGLSATGATLILGTETKTMTSVELKGNKKGETVDYKIVKTLAKGASVKSTFLTKEGKLSAKLSGTYKMPAYPGAETVFIADTGLKLEFISPTRGILSAKDPGTILPIDGCLVPTEPGPNAQLIFVPDLKPPMEATFFPEGSPHARIRGTYTEPTTAGSTGSFLPLPSEKWNIPTSSIPGLVVKNTVTSEVIEGVLVIEQGMSELRFKPEGVKEQKEPEKKKDTSGMLFDTSSMFGSMTLDAGFMQTSQAAATSAAVSQQGQPATLVTSSGQPVLGTVYLPPHDAIPGRFHPKDPESFKGLPEGNVVINIGDGNQQTIKCAIHKHIEGQSFVMMSVVDESKPVPAIFTPDDDASKKIKGLYIPSINSFQPDQFLEEDFSEMMSGKVVWAPLKDVTSSSKTSSPTITGLTSIGTFEPFSVKIGGPILPGKPIPLLSEKKDPTPAIFRYNDAPDIQIKGTWIPGPLGSIGEFKIDNDFLDKMRLTSSDGVIVIQDKKSFETVKGQLIPPLEGGESPKFFPEPKTGEASGLGYFYPFSQPNVAITGIASMSSVPGAPATFIPERPADLSSVVSSEGVIGVFVPATPNAKPVPISMKLTSSSTGSQVASTATFTTLTSKTKLASTISLSSLSSSLISGTFTMPPNPQGFGVFHPTEGLGDFSPGVIPAILNIPEIRWEPTSVNIHIPSNPEEPALITFDPIPPKPASFIPLSDPTMRIRGVYGEPIGSSIANPFQPDPMQPHAEIPWDMNMEGFIVIDDVASVPMKATFFPPGNGESTPRVQPEPASIGNVIDVVAYINGEKNGSPIEGRVEVSSNGARSGSPGVFVPNNPAEFRDRIHSSSEDYTSVTFVAKKKTVVTSVTRTTKCFQVLITKEMINISTEKKMVHFVVDPLTKPQKAYFTPESNPNLKIPGKTVPPPWSKPTDPMGFQPDNPQLFGASMPKGSVIGNIVFPSIDITKSISTSLKATITNTGELKWGGFAAMDLAKKFKPITSLLTSTGVRMSGDWQTGCDMNAECTFTPSDKAQMPTASFTGSMVRGIPGAPPITGMFVPVDKKFKFKPDIKSFGDPATLVTTTASGAKRTISGTMLVPDSPGKPPEFIPDSNEELAEAVPPGSPPASAVLLSADTSSPPLPILVSAPTSAKSTAPVKIVPDPHTIPGPAVMYIEGHPNDPISGKFVPTPQGGSFYAQDEDLVLKIVGINEKASFGGTVVQSISGAKPIPIQLNPPAGPGLPLMLEMETNIPQIATFTPISNPMSMITGKFSRTKGLDFDSFIPDLKEIAKIPIGGMEGFIWSPGKIPVKGTFNSAPGSSDGKLTFASGDMNAAGEKETSVFTPFSNPSESIMVYVTKASPLAKLTNFQEPLSLHFVDIEDAAKFSKEIEAGTLWSGEPGTKPTSVFLQAPLPGQFKTTVVPVNHDAPVPATFSLAANPDMKITGVWKPSSNPISPGHFEPDIVDTSWANMGMKGTISLAGFGESSALMKNSSISFKGTILSSVSGTASILPEIDSQPVPAVFFAQPQSMMGWGGGPTLKVKDITASSHKNLSIDSGAFGEIQSWTTWSMDMYDTFEKPVPISGTYTADADGDGKGKFVPNPEEAKKLPPGSVPGYISTGQIGTPPIAGSLNKESRTFKSTQPTTTVKMEKGVPVIKEKGVFRKDGNSAVEIPGSIVMKRDPAGGPPKGRFEPDNPSQLPRLNEGEHEGLFVPHTAHRPPVPLAFTAPQGGTSELQKGNVKSLEASLVTMWRSRMTMELITKTKKFSIEGKLNKPTVAGEAPEFIPNSLDEIKEIFNQGRERGDDMNSMQATFQSNNKQGALETFKGFVDFEIMAGSGEDNAQPQPTPIIIESKSPAPARFIPMNNPGLDLTGMLSDVTSSTSPMGSLHLSAGSAKIVGEEPITGFMAVDSSVTAPLVKGTLYPGKDAFTPPVFKPHGVILEKPEEVTFVPFGENRTPIPGTVQRGSDGSAAKFKPKPGIRYGGLDMNAAEGDEIEGVFTFKNSKLDPLSGTLLSPPQWKLSGGTGTPDFMNVNMMKKSSSTTVTVTTQDNQKILAKYTPAPTSTGTGIITPLDNTPLPRGQLQVTIGSEKKGHQLLTGTINVDSSSGGKISFTPDPRKGQVLLMPTNDPKDIIRATIIQPASPGQPVSIRVRPEDVRRLPKDPITIPMVFEGLPMPPQEVLLSPSTFSVATPMITILPPKFQEPEKVTFTPFDTPDVTIPGIMKPDPTKSSSPPMFIPERPEMWSLLGKSEGGVRGAIVSSAPDAKPLVGIIVPPMDLSKEFGAPIVFDEPKIIGPGPAMFRPLGHPELIIFGQYVPPIIPGDTGSFKPNNPHDLAKLPSGTHGGTVEGAGFKKFTASVTVKKPPEMSTSTVSTATPTAAAAPASTAGSILGFFSRKGAKKDSKATASTTSSTTTYTSTTSKTAITYEFAADRKNDVSTAVFIPSSNPALKIAGTFTETRNGGQFVPLPQDRAKLPKGRITGFVVPSSPGKGPFRADIETAESGDNEVTPAVVRRQIVPGASDSEASKPEPEVIEESEAEESKPEVSKQEVSKQGGSKAEVSKPEVSKSGGSKPEVSKPGVSKPGGKQEVSKSEGPKQAGPKSAGSKSEDGESLVSKAKDKLAKKISQVHLQSLHHEKKGEPAILYPTGFPDLKIQGHLDPKTKKFAPDNMAAFHKLTTSMSKMDEPSKTDSDIAVAKSGRKTAAKEKEKGGKKQKTKDLGGSAVPDFGSLSHPIAIPTFHGIITPLSPASPPISVEMKVPPIKMPQSKDDWGWTKPEEQGPAGAARKERVKDDGGWTTPEQGPSSVGRKERVKEDGGWTTPEQAAGSNAAKKGKVKDDGGWTTPEEMMAAEMDRLKMRDNEWTKPEDFAPPIEIMSSVDSTSSRDCSYISELVDKGVYKGSCTRPAVAGGPYSFIPVDPGMCDVLPKGQSAGSLMLGGSQTIPMEGVIYLRTKQDACSGTFQPGPRPSQEVYFVPNDNPSLRIPGTYAEPSTPGGQSSFKPSDPTALEDLPQGTLAGYIVPDGVNGEVITKGSIMNLGSSTTITEFRPESQVKGAPAMLIPSDGSPPIQGVYQLSSDSEGKGTFIPASAFGQGSSSSLSGTMVPSIAGVQPFPIMFEPSAMNMGMNKGSMDDDFKPLTFTEITAGETKIGAVFSPANNPLLKIPGFYQMPENPTGSGVFVPTNPADLEHVPTGALKGTVAPAATESYTDKQAFTPFNGTISITEFKATGSDSIKPLCVFTPAPPNNVPATFVSHMDPDLKIFGTYTSDSTGGGLFQPGSSEQWKFPPGSDPISGFIFLRNGAPALPMSVSIIPPEKPDKPAKVVKNTDVATPLSYTEPAVFHPDGKPDVSVKGIMHYSKDPNVKPYFAPLNKEEMRLVKAGKKLKSSLSIGGITSEVEKLKTKTGDLISGGKKLGSKAKGAISTGRQGISSAVSYVPMASYIPARPSLKKILYSGGRDMLFGDETYGDEEPKKNVKGNNSTSKATKDEQKKSGGAGAEKFEKGTSKATKTEKEESAAEESEDESGKPLTGVIIPSTPGVEPIRATISSNKGTGKPQYDILVDDATTASKIKNGVAGFLSSTADKAISIPGKYVAPSFPGGTPSFIADKVEELEKLPANIPTSFSAAPTPKMVGSLMSMMMPNLTSEGFENLSLGSVSNIMGNSGMNPLTADWSSIMSMKSIRSAATSAGGGMLSTAKKSFASVPSLPGAKSAESAAGSVASLISKSVVGAEGLAPESQKLSELRSTLRESVSSGILGSAMSGAYNVMPGTGMAKSAGGAAGSAASFLSKAVMGGQPVEGGLADVRSDLRNSLSSGVVGSALSKAQEVGSAGVKSKLASVASGISSYVPTGVPESVKSASSAAVAKGAAALKSIPGSGVAGKVGDLASAGGKVQSQISSYGSSLSGENLANTLQSGGGKFSGQLSNLGNTVSGENLANTLQSGGGKFSGQLSNLGNTLSGENLANSVSSAGATFASYLPSGCPGATVVNTLSSTGGALSVTGKNVTGQLSGIGDSLSGDNLANAVQGSTGQLGSTGKNVSSQLEKLGCTITSTTTGLGNVMTWSYISKSTSITSLPSSFQTMLASTSDKASTTSSKLASHLPKVPKKLPSMGGLGGMLPSGVPLSAGEKAKAWVGSFVPSGMKGFSLPSFSSAPSLPSLPSVPSLPSLPSAPSLPSLPSLPSAPSLPSLPTGVSLPSLSSAPSLPSMSALSSVVPKFGLGSSGEPSAPPPPPPGSGWKGIATAFSSAMPSYNFKAVSFGRTFLKPSLNSGKLSLLIDNLEGASYALFYPTSQPELRFNGSFTPAPPDDPLEGAKFNLVNKADAKVISGAFILGKLSGFLFWNDMNWQGYLVSKSDTNYIFLTSGQSKQAERLELCVLAPDGIPDVVEGGCQFSAAVSKFIPKYVGDRISLDANSGILIPRTLSTLGPQPTRHNFPPGLVLKVDTTVKLNRAIQTVMSFKSIIERLTKTPPQSKASFVPSIDATQRVTGTFVGELNPVDSEVGAFTANNADAIGSIAALANSVGGSVSGYLILESKDIEPVKVAIQILEGNPRSLVYMHVTSEKLPAVDAVYTTDNGKNFRGGYSAPAIEGGSGSFVPMDQALGVSQGWMFYGNVKRHGSLDARQSPYIFVAEPMKPANVMFTPAGSENSIHGILTPPSKVGDITEFAPDDADNKINIGQTLGLIVLDRPGTVPIRGMVNVKAPVLLTAHALKDEHLAANKQKALIEKIQQQVLKQAAKAEEEEEVVEEEEAPKGETELKGSFSMLDSPAMSVDEDKVFTNLLRGDPSADPYNAPDYEISIVPMGDEKPPRGFSEQNRDLSPSIRGIFFRNTISTKQFVPYTGIVASFVINSVSPVDPKAQKLIGHLVPRQPTSPQDIGPDKHDAEFFVKEDASIDQSTLAPKQSGILFGVGAMATGINGYIVAKPGDNVGEYYFFSRDTKEPGIYKKDGNVGCFYFNELAEITPFDDTVLARRAEEEKRIPRTMQVFNFQGSKNAPVYDIYFPLEGSKGKLTVDGYVIHGLLIPRGSGDKATFNPDDPNTYKLVKSGAQGSFEQDETPAVSGIFPGNGLTGKIDASYSRPWEVTFDRPGRTGQLNPGKRALPGFYVYCLALIDNTGESPQIKIMSVQDPAQKIQGRSMGVNRKPRGTGELAKLLKGRSATKGTKTDDKPVVGLLHDLGRVLVKGGYQVLAAKPKAQSKDKKEIFSASVRGLPKELESVKGKLYISTFVDNIFIPDAPESNGTLHFLLPPTRAFHMDGKFKNSKDDMGDLAYFIPTGDVKEKELTALLHALTKIRGIFRKVDEKQGISVIISEMVPNNNEGDNGDNKEKIQLVLRVENPGVRGYLRLATQNFTSPYRPYQPVTPASLHGCQFASGLFLPDEPMTNGTFSLANGKGTPTQGQLSCPLGIEDNKGKDISAQALYYTEDDGVKNSTENGGIVVGTFTVPTSGNLTTKGTISASAFPRIYLFTPQAPVISGWQAMDFSFTPDAYVDVNVHQGWKTQFQLILPNITLRYEDEIFYGFGNCPVRENQPGELLEADGDEDVAHYYMTLLRTYCNSKQKHHILSVLQDGLLVARNKLMVVKEDHPLLNHPKLNRHQLDHLSTAFEMSIFSITYGEQLNKGINVLEIVRNSDGERMSRSAKFLINLSLNYLRHVNDIAPKHAVHLSRNLVTTLLTAMAKLKQDSKALDKCEECILDKEITRVDCQEVMAMVQFIIHEYMGRRGEDDLKTQFKEFRDKHKIFIIGMTKKMEANDD